MSARIALRTLSAALLLSLAACASDWSLRFRNGTGVPLEYCPVVTDPPPPHRKCTRVLEPLADANLDPEEFNPVLYDPQSKLGAYVQMALEDDPPTILVRVAQLVVPPGEEGKDPGKQPLVLADYPFEADPDGPKDLLIRVGPIEQQIPISITQQ